jgi:hypothetical protein
MYINIYQNKNLNGELTGDLVNNSQQLAADEPDMMTTLDEVKDNIRKWVRGNWGEYVATLSNDGIDHTPEMLLYAEEMLHEKWVEDGVA